MHRDLIIGFLRAIAPREILALTPGYADMDFTRLPYAYVTRLIVPLDNDVRWHPIITNVAGYGEEFRSEA